MSSGSSTHLMHRSPPFPLTGEVQPVCSSRERDLTRLMAAPHSVVLLRTSAVITPVLSLSWNPLPSLERGWFSSCSSWNCFGLLRGMWQSPSLRTFPGKRRLAAKWVPLEFRGRREPCRVVMGWLLERGTSWARLTDRCRIRTRTWKTPVQWRRGARSPTATYFCSFLFSCWPIFLFSSANTFDSPLESLPSSAHDSNELATPSASRITLWLGSGWSAFFFSPFDHRDGHVRWLISWYPLLGLLLQQVEKKSSNFVQFLGYVRMIHELLWAKQRRRQSVLGLSRETKPTG